MSVLVIAEHDNAALKGATLNAVTAAKAIDADVHVLVAGASADAAAAAAAKVAGVAKVIHVDAPHYGHGLAEPSRRADRRTGARAMAPSWRRKPPRARM
jgi:electron transfer flavoprotein alpha subunit